MLTLREALALADADSSTADRIEFAPEVQGQTIVLAGGQLTVNSDVTIDGGAGVTIDANQASRVLLVQGLGTDVVLQHLTITGGRLEFDRGGGILAYDATSLIARRYATRSLTSQRYSQRQPARHGGGGITASADHNCD